MTKTPKIRKKYRTDTKQSTIGDILDYCISEIDCFVEDIGGWRDNMDGTPLENTMKYEEVSQAADQLETIQQSMQEVSLDDIPEGVKNVVLSYKEIHRYGKKADPRWMLMSNVISQLNAVIEFFEDWGDFSPDSLVQSLQEVTDEGESVEFPGMF